VKGMIDEIAKALRPISLASFFLKAKGTSKLCETALYDLVDRIQEALNHNMFAFGTFL
jgi:hypothetical protein